MFLVNIFHLLENKGDGGVGGWGAGEGEGWVGDERGLFTFAKHLPLVGTQGGIEGRR